MSGISLILGVAAIAGIVGSQIYLRIDLRSANQRRSIERFVALCTLAAILGYGAVTADCIASTQCTAGLVVATAPEAKFSVPSRGLTR